MTCDLIDRVFVPVFHSFVKGNQRNIYLIIFDGMRYDLWQELKPLVEECFNSRLTLHHEECALSILPSATQYTRKAIFAGAFPADWKRRGNNIDPETSEIRLFKEALYKRNIPYTDRLPDDLVTGGESEMKEEVLHALIEDKAQIIKPLIFNVADDKIHNEDADLKTLYDMVIAEFQNKIRPLLNKIDGNSIVIITSDHGFYEIWGARKQIVPGFYGAIRWRYGALRKDESKLGYPDDVMRLRSKDIKLNVEYTYHLETTKEFGGIEVDATGGKKKVAYPLYIFCKPKAILVRTKVDQGENVDHLLGEAEIFEGNTKQRYEHGGISLQELIIPVVVYVPGKKTGKPDVRVEHVERTYIHGMPATLTLKLSNYGNVPAEWVKVSIESIDETKSVERLDPGEQVAQHLDFAFVPTKESARRIVTIVYVYEGQQMILTPTIILTVEDEPGQITRRKVF